VKRILVEVFGKIESVPVRGDTHIDLDSASTADRAWFEAHLDEPHCVRDFVPGEFPEGELPNIPDGFRYGTLVTMIGAPCARMRQMIMFSTDEKALRKEFENHSRYSH